MFQFVMALCRDASDMMQAERSTNFIREQGLQYRNDGTGVVVNSAYAEALATARTAVNE